MRARLRARYRHTSAGTPGADPFDHLLRRRQAALDAIVVEVVGVVAGTERHWPDVQQPVVPQQVEGSGRAAFAAALLT